MSWLLALLLLPRLALAAEGGTRAQIKESKQQLRQKKQEIRATQKQKAALARAEQSQLKLIVRADAELAARRNDMRTHEHNLQITEEKIAAAERLNQAYIKDVESNRAWLARELRLMQKSGPMGEVTLLLSAKEPAELISRYRFIKALARQNARKVQDTRLKMAKLDEYARFHKVRELELKNYKSATELARVKAEAEKRRRNALLNGIRQKKGRTETLLKELEGSAQSLQEKMDQLQQAAAAAAEAARARETRHMGGNVEIDINSASTLGRRHSLPWPVRGRLLTRFGEQMHPKFHTKVFNRGIEIAAPLGSPVVAVAPGTAKFADYFEGYGQMVILDHGGGYFTVYGHNSQLSVKPEQRVQRGEQIAEVGDSSTSGRASLYFEIRALAKAMDPMQWLSR